MSVPVFIDPSSEYLAQPDAVILDASWLYQPPPHRNARREYEEGPRYPNARWWDLEAVSEPHPDGYALMLPSPERFAAYASQLGISRTSHVIVYDGEGVFAAPRTAWTFKVYGHEKVSIINGGLPRAKKENVALEIGSPRPFKATEYPVPRLKAGDVVEFPEIQHIASRTNTTSDDILLLDARPTASFSQGHIPTSVSFDFPNSLLTDPTGYTYVRESRDLVDHLTAQLGQQTAERVLRGNLSVVNTCGGGLSAAINWALLQSLGITSRLYDESWGGYSARHNTPRVIGPNPL